MSPIEPAWPFGSQPWVARANEHIEAIVRRLAGTDLEALAPATMPAPTLRILPGGNFVTWLLASRTRTRLRELRSALEIHGPLPPAPPRSILRFVRNPLVWIVLGGALAILVWRP